MFHMPEYREPDFTKERFANAPDAAWEKVTTKGVAPENYHSTSMYPEYFKIDGQWKLAKESRMDSSVVLGEDGELRVVENRNLQVGDKVILGRTENAEEGIYLHSTGFEDPEEGEGDQFVFRQGRSRETSYARDYDRLFELLKYEREHGNILWVMGPAFSFDADARRAMQAMVENGYVDGLMAGNALATHDLEGAMFHTALGQDIYTQKSQPNGHYNHLDVINRVRKSGSIPQFIDDYKIDNGIMYSCVKEKVPFVLTGSIRDDGPLPEVRRRLRRTDRHAEYGKKSDHRCLPGNHAPHHRHRQYDAVLPRFRGRNGSSGLPLHRGRRRVRGQQALRPWQPGGDHHRHQRAGLYHDRGKRTGRGVKRL